MINVKQLYHHSLVKCKYLSESMRNHSNKLLPIYGTFFYSTNILEYKRMHNTMSKERIC